MERDFLHLILLFIRTAVSNYSTPENLAYKNYIFAKLSQRPLIYIKAQQVPLRA